MKTSPEPISRERAMPVRRPARSVSSTSSVEGCSTRRGTMYNVDPHTFLWLHEQNRELEQTQRALERAAQTGERRPGLVRAGISGFTRLARETTANARTVGFGGTTTASPTGSAGA